MSSMWFFKHFEPTIMSIFMTNEAEKRKTQDSKKEKHKAYMSLWIGQQTQYTVFPGKFFFRWLQDNEQM